MLFSDFYRSRDPKYYKNWAIEREKESERERERKIERGRRERQRETERDRDRDRDRQTDRERQRERNKHIYNLEGVFFVYFFQRQMFKDCSKVHSSYLWFITIFFYDPYISTYCIRKERLIKALPNSTRRR